MRKVVLSPNDFDLFNTDITFAEFEFIHKHWDAFRRMWKEQGQKFWISFVITYRSYATAHGAIRDIANVNDKYQALIDETFIFLHENFIEGKYRDAKNLIEELLVLAQNKGMIQYLGSKSFAKDPFYNKDTRDCFRHLFGPPTEKVSYVKVCVLHDLYTRFGGAIFKCLKRWLEAEEVPPGGENIWDPMELPKPQKTVPKIAEICSECYQEYGAESPRRFSDNDFVTYMMEKRTGQRCGPWYVPGWTLHEDPRFHDPKNPLYDISKDPEADWRNHLGFNKFSSFIEYVRQYYPTPSVQMQAIDADAENDPAVMELWKRMFEIGIGDSVLDNLTSSNQVGLENMIKMLELQDDIKKERGEKPLCHARTVTKSKKPASGTQGSPANTANVSRSNTTQADSGTCTMTLSTSDDGKREMYIVKGVQVIEAGAAEQKQHVAMEEADIQRILGLSDRDMHVRVNTHNLDGTTQVAFQANGQTIELNGSSELPDGCEGLMNDQDYEMLKDALKDVLGALSVNDGNEKSSPKSDSVSAQPPTETMKEASTVKKSKKSKRAKNKKSATDDVSKVKAADKTNSKPDISVKDKLKNTESVDESLPAAVNKDYDLPAGYGPVYSTTNNTGFEVNTPADRKMEALFLLAEAGDIFARLKIGRVLAGVENLSDTEESASMVTPTSSERPTSLDGSTIPKKKLKLCANCKKVEEICRTFKKCQICKEQKLSSPRYYCGKECQVEDWKAKHKIEHRENSLT